ncbi:FtsK/SpoIIIE domain-containing protein [Klenkia terrae]|uniref:FtsK/SpoIIIE domain-containing protein n=1 Tax=Klenkia terrae TaxID=1052259 RepID=UPI003615178B
MVPDAHGAAHAGRCRGHGIAVHQRARRAAGLRGRRAVRRLRAGHGRHGLHERRRRGQEGDGRQAPVLPPAPVPAAALGPAGGRAAAPGDALPAPRPRPAVDHRGQPPTVGAAGRPRRLRRRADRAGPAGAGHPGGAAADRAAGRAGAAVGGRAAPVRADLVRGARPAGVDGPQRVRPGARPGPRRAAGGPGPRGGRPAHHPPQPRRRPGRRVRRHRPARGVGVRQVAAARPAPRAVGRPGPGAAHGADPAGAGGPARRPGRRPAAVQPQRTGDHRRRPARARRPGRRGDRRLRPPGQRGRGRGRDRAGPDHRTAPAAGPRHAGPGGHRRRPAQQPHHRRRGRARPGRRAHRCRRRVPGPAARPAAAVGRRHRREGDDRHHRPGRPARHHRPVQLRRLQRVGPRPNRDQLRVPIGVGADGAPLELDLKESAQDGVGPHGLLVGATGSGKSELLRTLVLALACTHDSETLNFVLSDFKGGATFTRLDRLPHTSAVITNLADELPLVDRMTDAINGELVRRQELLRSAGNYASLRDYERARLSGVPLAPLPSLLIVCDEFSELLSAKPDFIDMFVQIGRVGRSLGVHLLLASQRLEEGRLRGLDTHLSYRIALRTNSAMESRVVLSAPDAFELPRAPGFGYVKFGTDPLERFRAAYVSGTYRRASAAPDVGTSAGPAVLAYESSYVAPALPVPTEDDDADVPDPTEVDTLGESLLDVLVDRLEGQGTPPTRCGCRPCRSPRRWTSCCRPWSPTRPGA